jgi:hypothetical protein
MATISGGSKNTFVRVGFSTPKMFNPVSWVVRKITGSKASHAWFLYYDEDWELSIVMEAHEFGFRLIPYSRFRNDNHVVGLFLPKVPIDVGLKYVAHRYLGSTYDYLGLMGQIVVQLGRRLKRRWKNPFRGSKNVFCSEAVCIAMQKSPGYEKFEEDPDSVDPQKLLQYYLGGFGTPCSLDS